jgi:hypothetical protein
MKKPFAMTEKELKGMFDQNFERLRAENGHSLSPEVREAAWQQVRLYWTRLRHIAEAVTDTEVELSLPNQKTPKGCTFCIQGVVDNCDVRFSCDSYRIYARKHHDRNWRKFAAFYDAPPDEGEDQDRMVVSVDAVAAAMEAAEDL